LGDGFDKPYPYFQSAMSVIASTFATPRPQTQAATVRTLRSPKYMAGHGKETQRSATGKASGIDRTVRLKAL
jgi:hypothetical protein